jgi:23S rRNA (uridine2552-2'-O)-methyltransferase
MAKKIGYRSRSAFKLAQLDRRHNLIRRGDTVVDLGAAPGGWLQVARGKVGEEGFVLGVDLQPIAELPHKNVKTLVADITDDLTSKLIRGNLPRPADVVLSDASPKISGTWTVDHQRSVELAFAALTVAERVLKPGGNVLIKVFQGEHFGEFTRKVKERFEFVKASKPVASRKGSAEIYVIAKGFKTRCSP